MDTDSQMFLHMLSPQLFDETVSISLKNWCLSFELVFRSKELISSHISNHVFEASHLNPEENLKTYKYIYISYFLKHNFQTSSLAKYKKIYVSWTWFTFPIFISNQSQTSSLSNMPLTLPKHCFPWLPAHSHQVLNPWSLNPLLFKKMVHTFN